MQHARVHCRIHGGLSLSWMHCSCCHCCGED
jgi:hypothetical protein